MSSIWKFVSRGGNLESHGFLKDCQYTLDNRRPIKDDPDSFMYTVIGPGLAKALPLRETTIWKEFTLIQNDPVNPVPTGPATMAAMNNQQSVPAQQPLPQQTPVQQPIIPPVSGGVIPVGGQPATIAPPPVQAPKVTAEQIIQAIDNLGMHFDSVIKKIPAPVHNVPSIIGTSTKDLLLSELLKLDFVSCNIKIIKSDKDSSICVIVDSLPPLSHTAKDISAQDIVTKITSTFTEQAMLITSCREWVKAAQELNAKKEEEAKKLKKESEAKPVVPKTETAKPAAAGKSKSVADKKAEQETAVAQQAQMLIPEAGNEPEGLIDEYPVDNGGSMEFPVEESAIGNGLTPEVSDFIL
jgi:hypothetical protein